MSSTSRNRRRGAGHRLVCAGAWRAASARDAFLAGVSEAGASEAAGDGRGGSTGRRTAARSTATLRPDLATEALGVTIEGM
jgi:hypothetical protein